MPEHLLEFAVEPWCREARAFADARGLTVVDVELDRAFHDRHIVVRDTMTGTVEDAAVRLEKLDDELSRATYGGGSRRHFTTSPPKVRGDWEHRIAVALPDERLTPCPAWSIARSSTRR